MTKHDEVATKLANKFGTTYNRGQGPDIETNSLAIEVETRQSLGKDGLRQLQGFQKKVYIVMADDADIQYALDMTEGTTVGVMYTSGQIRKDSTRGS